MTPRGPRMDLRGDGSGRPALRAAFVTLVILASGIAASPAAAQTVRPVIVEYRQGRAEGRFELVNDGLVPLTVVLEPRSFEVTDAGEPIYLPLDPRIRVRLSTMSLRIPAGQTRVVFYEASADSLPAWFTIASTFSGQRVKNGLEVRVEMPHTVYLLQKEPIARGGVGVTLASYDPAAHQVAVAIENWTGRLGRAIETDIIGPGHRERIPSFPMLPRGRRHLLLPWNAAHPPDRVVVHFAGFDIERSFAEVATAGN